jgi:TonB family protein
MTRFAWSAFAALVFFGAVASVCAQPEPAEAPTRTKPGKEDTKPKPIQMDPPRYPEGMSRAGLIGAVAVEFIIDREGRVVNPVIVESNNPWFERPALDAVLRWKFHPGLMDGRPVATRVTQKIEFQLEGGGATFWRISKTRNHDQLPLEMQWHHAPTVSHSVFPVYPFAALQTKTKGKTKLSFIIGPDGKTHHVRLEEATAPEMGLAVRAMLDAWRFNPGRMRDYTPAYAMVAIEHEFAPSGAGDVPVPPAARAILRLLEKKPAEIATIEELDRPLKSISRRPPVYPTALLDVGQPGAATIEFFVDKNGDAQLPRIVTNTAPEFGYAAAQAIATWRFEPPMKAGKAVIVRVQIPLEFTPREEGPKGR